MSRSTDDVGLITRRGFGFLAGGLLACGVIGSLGRIITMRLARWEDYPVSEWPPTGTLVIPYHRASILDTRGECLAETVSFLGLMANRFQIGHLDEKELESILDELARILGRDRKEIEDLLVQEHPVVWIERPLSPEQLSRLDTYLIKGGALTGFRKQRFFTRIYPHFPAGSAVIGYVFQKLIPDKEALGHCYHEADKYNKGLENTFFGRLEGDPGRMKIPRDKLNRFLVHETTLVEPAVHGEPIQVALDIKLQREIEEIIEDHRRAWSAEIALATVARVDSGDLLCAARMPQGPPDRPCWKWEESLSNCENFIGSFYFGSVMKPLFYAGAIQAGAVSPDEIIDVPHSIRIGGKTFTNRRRFPARMSVSDCLVHSVKTGAILIAERLERRIGREGIIQMLKDFGIGETVGLPFPLESGGLLPEILKSSFLYIAEACIGYEAELNHLLLIRAYSCFARKGRSVLPRLLVAQGPHKDDMAPLPVRSGSSPISEETAEAILRMLEEAVIRGTGRKAAVEGGKIAGKTGTAQALRRKPKTPKGAPPPVGPFGLLEDRVHCTFAGYLGRSHIIAVSFLFAPVVCPTCLEAEKSGRRKKSGSCVHVYASSVACPAFRDIAHLLVRPGAGNREAEPDALDSPPGNLA